MTTSAFDKASKFCGFASYECGSAAGSLMIDVTATASPPMRSAMFPYTFVDATTNTLALVAPPPGGAPPELEHADATTTEAAATSNPRRNLTPASASRHAIGNGFHYR